MIIIIVMRNRPIKEAPAAMIGRRWASFAIVILTLHRRISVLQLLT